MAQWRKVIVSGSNSELHQVTSSGGIDIEGTSISGSSVSTGSFGYLNVHGDGVFGGNLTFGDANTDSVSFGADIDSNLIPNTDDTYDLGSATQAWQDLFLEGDITLTDAGTVKTSAGALTIDGAGGVNIQEGSATVISIDDSQNLTLNNISGKTVSIGHSTSETTIGDNLTVTGDATIGGDLDVNGTLTTIDTTNLRVADKFIIMASGSTSGDSGLIASTAANGSGSAFMFDDSATRWGITGVDEVGDSQTTAVPRQYVTTVSQSAVDPTGNPNDFGADAATRRGMIHINTDTGDIFIFS
jgi:cytoskeletal protein CcmA (bactofilin family)